MDGRHTYPSLGRGSREAPELSPSLAAYLYINRRRLFYFPLVLVLSWMPSKIKLLVLYIFILYYLYIYLVCSVLDRHSGGRIATCRAKVSLCEAIILDDTGLKRRCNTLCYIRIDLPSLGSDRLGGRFIGALQLFFMDQFHPFLVRMRIAALQSEYVLFSSSPATTHLWASCKQSH